MQNNYLISFGSGRFTRFSVAALFYTVYYRCFLSFHECLTSVSASLLINFTCIISLYFNIIILIFYYIILLYYIILY